MIALKFLLTGLLLGFITYLTIESGGDVSGTTMEKVIVGMAIATATIIILSILTMIWTF